MVISTLQRRIYVSGAICGCALALLITLLDLLGWLSPLENWLYDQRAVSCQYFTPKPSTDIVYLDIDNEALETIQRWPWDRSRMAAVLNELKLANPKVLMLDIIFGDAQKNRIEETPDQQYREIEEDPALTNAIAGLGNVVLGSSFALQPAMDSAAKRRADAVQLLTRNVLLEAPELLNLLKLPPNDRDSLRSQIEGEFTEIRRDAIRQAVRNAFDSGKESLDSIQRNLIVSLGKPGEPVPYKLKMHLGIIAQEYEHVRSERILYRAMLDAPQQRLSALPPDATYSTIPLPTLCEKMAGSGYTDHQDRVVRSVPLFVQVDGRFYPQIALVTACRLADADLSKAVFTDHSVTIPAAQGNICIPVHATYSETMHRQVGFVMDIPWYGTHQWETMNDWPSHRAFSQHYPIDSVWSVVEASRRLQSNDALLDECLKFFYELDPSFKHSGIDRPTAIDRLQKDLHELGYEQLLQSDPMQRSGDEKQIVRFMTALKDAAGQNALLPAEIKSQHALLARRFSGKAVLIGATATATSDFVTTSLHARCPGVVVHGVMINAIVNRHFLTTSPWWLNCFLVLLAGLVATAITCMLPPARGVLLLLLIGFAYFVLNGRLFYDRLNWIVDAAAPLVAIFICWGGVLVVRTIVETLERLRLKQEAAMIDHEIELARQVQKALIPKKLQIMETVDSHGWTKAATTTGGDCFDLWRLKDGRMGILVGDASGHGLGPSIVVSQVRALIRSMCDLYEEPQAVLNVVNARLFEDLDGRKFCTCFLGFLSDDGKLSWGSAGHGPMLWAPTSDAEIKELDGTALPLGVSDDPCAEEVIPVLELQPGGWLAVVSDGIFEAPNPKDEQFGVERINECIRATREGPSEASVEAIRRCVDAWQVKPIPDD
ncbi:MAG: protein phosphatase 2C-like, stage sporulation, partial [Phycisphaerales bacterium]|nr:protein phosphatase 2C-like, stage sporulation [Phycisphaerales bacterium]